MSTNIYWHEKPCKHCGRGEEPIHITKSFTSWQWLVEEDDMCVLEVIVSSVSDWIEWLRAHEGEGDIIDEYNKTYTVEEFVLRVNQVPTEARRRQYDWCLQNPGYASFSRVSDGPAEGKHWLDHDGFTFYGGEFS